MSDLQADTDRAPALLLHDRDWRIDRQRSEIGFAVKNLWGLQTVRGAFRTYNGTLTVRSGAAAGKLTIEAASLDTGHGRRDRHLRSPDFFDVERHPQIVFTATSVTARNGGLVVTGELAIGSSRLRLEIPVKIEPLADGAQRLEGETTVTREAAGMTWNRLGSVGGEAALHAHVTLEAATA